MPVYAINCPKAFERRQNNSEAAQTNNKQDKEGEGPGAQQLETKKKTEDGRSVPTNEWFEEACKLGRDE